MSDYNKIIEALDFIGRYNSGFGKSGLSVSFEIRIPDDSGDMKTFEFPSYMVQTVRNEVKEIIDYSFTISFPLESENDMAFHSMKEEIKNSKFKCDFKISKVDRYELTTSLGPDIKTAGTIVLYYMLMFIKTGNYVIRTSYTASLYQRGDLSKIVHKDNMSIYFALQNVLKDLFRYTQYEDSIYLEIVNVNGRKLMGNVLISKTKEDDGYTAWIQTEKITPFNFEGTLSRFQEFKNRDCTRYVGFGDNKWGTRLNFTLNQKDDLIYFISDFFTMVYPSLTSKNVLVRVPFFNHPPTINLNLCFFPDGKMPSDRELQFIQQLVDNFEYDYSYGAINPAELDND